MYTKNGQGKSGYLCRCSKAGESSIEDINESPNCHVHTC